MALGPSDLSGSIYQTMQQNGWVTAGSYYFQFAQGSNGLYTAQTPTLSVTPTTKESQALSGYRISQFAAGELVTKMGKSVSNTGLGAITPGLSKVTPGLNYMVTGFIYMLNHSGSSNPIVSISTFGFIMMVLAEVLFVTIAGLIALYSFLFSWFRLCSR